MSSLQESPQELSIVVDGVADSDKFLTTHALLTPLSVNSELSQQNPAKVLNRKHGSPLPVEANFPLFIIYTSGSTGKPKGIVHAHGYVSGVMMTMQCSFDIVPGADIIFVLASFGWITGQSYMLAGSLASRVTSFMTEANPVSPYVAHFASLIERYNVSILKGGVAFLKFLMS